MKGAPSGVASFEVEVLKLRRATAARVAAAAVVVGVPALAAGFTAVSRAGGDSTLALKVRAMGVGTGWEAYGALVAQLMSVAVLLAVGVVVCWSFGRELTDGTFGTFFAVPTPRRRAALAKLVVLVAWGAATCLMTVAVAVALGAAVVGPGPGADASAGALRAVAVGLLTVLLTVPLAWVASACRGYLPGIAALLGLVVATQLATVAGAGAWFPWASPGLWAGLGGAAAAAAVTPVQLLLALPVAAVGAAATSWWWDHAEVV